MKKLQKLYPNEMGKLFIHHDAASSHTSRFTQDFMDKQSEIYGLSFIKKSEVPVKSPYGSPLDFFGIGYLKQMLSKTRASSLLALM